MTSLKLSQLCGVSFHERCAKSGGCHLGPPTQRGLKVEMRAAPAWQNDLRGIPALLKIDARVMIADTRGNTGL